MRREVKVSLIALGLATIGVVGEIAMYGNRNATPTPAQIEAGCKREYVGTMALDCIIRLDERSLSQMNTAADERAWRGQ